jgi:hypothetical protein
MGLMVATGVPRWSALGGIRHGCGGITDRNGTVRARELNGSIEFEPTEIPSDGSENGPSRTPGCDTGTEGNVLVCQGRLQSLRGRSMVSTTMVNMGLTILARVVIV